MMIALFVIGLIGTIWILIAFGNKFRKLCENFDWMINRFESKIKDFDDQKEDWKNKQNELQEKFSFEIEEWNDDAELKKINSDIIQEKFVGLLKNFNDMFFKFSEVKDAHGTLIASLSEIEEKFDENADKVTDFNEIVKIFMDHTQQRAVRILEFNEILTEFVEVLEIASKSGSSMWIHDPFFRTLRSNMEEMIKAISGYQQEAMQSIQFLTKPQQQNDEETKSDS